MKFSLVLCSLLGSAFAAPAVVWKKNQRSSQRFLHTSDELAASDLLNGAFQDSSLSVVFLVGKGQDGSESFTELASTGKLPVTAEKYTDADGIYHHVSGIESAAAMVREATALTEQKVLAVSLNELNKKLDGGSKVEIEVDQSGVTKPSSKSENKRARDLVSASVLVVNVDPKTDAAEIDRSVANAIDNREVESVVLAGIRSLSEVKRERALAAQQRKLFMQKQGERVLEARRRRRLEEAEGDDGAQEDGDMSGVYYVSMTPNILAGLLFLGLFTMMTWIGISCMGAISGQDVYVSKMPSIGREA